MRQVLTFARGAKSERKIVNIQEVIYAVEKIARDTFPKNINLRINIEEDAWTVMGDFTQLHQVVLNLCVNSRNAMPQGGTLTITTKNRELDDNFLASVAD